LLEGKYEYEDLTLSHKLKAWKCATIEVIEERKIHVQSIAHGLAFIKSW